MTTDPIWKMLVESCLWGIAITVCGAFILGIFRKGGKREKRQ